VFPSFHHHRYFVHIKIMRSAFVFSALASSALVAAQQAPVVIEVGGPSTGPTIYTPNSVTAPNGTVVTFRFTGTPGNHTVTQSSFAAPCTPLEGGFDSGWVFINATTTSPPEWNLTITNDAKPIWFYCKQLQKSPHCLAGMVGAINVAPGATNDISAFQVAAKTQAAVGEGQNGLGGVGATATATPNVGSVATLVLGPSSAAAGGASGGGGGAAPNSTDGAAPAQSSKPGSALAIGVSSVTVVFTALFGMALAL